MREHCSLRRQYEWATRGRKAWLHRDTGETPARGLPSQCLWNFLWKVCFHFPPTKYVVVTISHILFYNILRMIYSLVFSAPQAPICWHHSHTQFAINTLSDIITPAHILWGPHLDFEKWPLILTKDKLVIGFLLLKSRFLKCINSISICKSKYN